MDKLYSNYTDDINRLYSIINKKLSGVQIVREYIPKSLLQDLEDCVINKSEYILLSRAYTEELSLGDKRKVSNVIKKKINPVVIEIVSKINADKQVDLNLPTIEEILSEIRKDKSQIRITGRPVKMDKKLTEVDCEQVKKEENTLKDIIDNINKAEVTQKRIITDSQKTIINHLRNKLYNRDKIEILPNQYLESFVDGELMIKNYMLDLVICDKQTFDIICVISIVDKAGIDFGAVLLNKLNIKRFIVKQINGLLDRQDIRDIEEEINNRYAPRCKMCGLPMIQKENIKTKHRFYACMDNKLCRYTIDMGD